MLLCYVGYAALLCLLSLVEKSQIFEFFIRFVKFTFFPFFIDAIPWRKFCKFFSSIVLRWNRSLPLWFWELLPFFHFHSFHCFSYYLHATGDLTDFVLVCETFKEAFDFSFTDFSSSSSPLEIHPQGALPRHHFIVPNE